MMPRFIVYTPADRATRIGWNRYFEGEPGQVTIGAAVVIFGRCFSLQWRRP